MFSRKIFLLLMFLWMLFPSFAAYTYNSSWTNLTLGANGWCINFNIPFRVYNQTDYENRKSIKDNLCDSTKNETPSEDNCFIFNTITGKYNIHDGPLESSKIIKSGNLVNSSFSYFFNRTDQYLIEVFPEGNYNDYHDVFYTKDCKVSEEEVKKKAFESLSLKNKTFSYSNSMVILELVETKYETSDSFNVSISTSTSKLKIKDLENLVKIINISGGDNFSSLKITFKLDSPKGEDEIFLYKYGLEKWNLVNNAKYLDNEIIYDKAKLGVYAISRKANKKNFEPVENNSQNKENNLSISNKNEDLTLSNKEAGMNELKSSKKEDLSGEIAGRDLASESKKSKSKNSLIIFGIVLAGILVLILGFVFISKQNKQKGEDKVEHVTQYSLVLKKTQEYVQKYKEEYTKDQIYRALKEAKVPRDIIDKVFLREF